MGTQQSTRRSPRDREWTRALVFAWLAGALVLQPPFQRFYKLGSGNLGYNLLIGAALVALGVLVLVSVVHLSRHIVQGCPWELRQGRLSSWGFAIAGGTFMASLWPSVPFGIYWAGLAALGTALLVMLMGDFLALVQRGPARLFPRLLTTPRAWRYNGAFWLLVLLVLLARDLVALGEIENRNTWDTTLLVAGRLCSLGCFTVAAIILSHALLALFPRYTRWVVGAGTVLVPLVIIADAAAGHFWQQPLLDIINNLTLDGDFDMQEELEAAGIRQSPLQVTIALIAVIGLATGAYFGLQKLSHHLDLRIRTSRAVLLLGALWLGTIAQQGLAKTSLRKEIWQAEHATFLIHLGLFSPDPGLATLAVELSEERTVARNEELLEAPLPTLTRKPDIYVIMIETWRSDTVTPKIMPFVSRFAKEECQQFDLTFAGSNCTPVSWFTLFHSRLGIYWREALAEGKEPGGFKGSYPIRLLHKLGYRFSVRAVCDLGYKAMCDLNFGANHKFASEFIDSPMLPDLDIPEREILIVDDLKKNLASTPAGGYLHYLSLDSAHYNYYWPSKDFTPIHQDCAKIDFGSLKPTQEQVREVVKRYENSVNWIDHQIEDFVGFLKEHNRYENSIIILTGDHGEEFQENGAWFHCSSLRREQTEVPIMIRWPEWVESQPAQKQVSHMDIMPSVLDALGMDEKYFEDLAGDSVLRDHPGEALLSTRWPGKSNVGVCFVKNGLKANFAARALWLDGIPDTLYFMGYTDLQDNPVSSLEIRGERSQVGALRDNYPDITNRYFRKFNAAR